MSAGSPPGTNVVAAATRRRGGAGAAGVSAEYPINRYFRDAKVVQIIEGTNQVQRNIIAGSVLGKVST